MASSISKTNVEEYSRRDAELAIKLHREDDLYGELMYDMHVKCFTPIIYIDLSNAQKDGFSPEGNLVHKPRWSVFVGYCSACRQDVGLQHIVSARFYHNPNPATEV